MDIFLRILPLAALVLATAASAKEPVFLSAEDCRRVVAHTPDADVAYQPGIDANGVAVVSADLGGGGGLVINPDDIAIAIDIPLRAVAGDPGDETSFATNGRSIDRYAATGSVGEVTVRGGQVYFDGKPLGNREAELLAAACREQANKP